MHTVIRRILNNCLTIHHQFKFMLTRLFSSIDRDEKHDHDKNA
jgi:hypothetical protein